ncbi:MAG: hypothetical protein O3A00_24915, partial [Planctomycetota bacterium]|nr:hypothetical protein [Planctomycetota bacterium]
EPIKTPKGGKKSAIVTSPRSKSKPVVASQATEQVGDMGDPRLSADTFLDRVFEHDEPARRALEFLQVFTLRELEQLDPDQLIARLSSPTIQTVGRIRKRLAVLNRSLKGDEKFARKFQARVRSEGGGTPK